MSSQELTPSSHWFIDGMLLTIACASLYLLWLGHYPLFVPDEGRYAEVAREMIAGHDYITPRIEGVPFLDKPILHYWLEVVAMQWFGIKEWSIRFFPAFFGIAGCLMTYGFGRMLFNRRTGLIAASILATTPLYFGAAHYANLDLEVAVLISGTLFAWITGATATTPLRKMWCLVAYGFAAFAFLAKGLIGVALPGLIALAWIIALRRFDIFKKIFLLQGTLLFAVIALPWYILASRANPDLLHYFFVVQQFSRFLSTNIFSNRMPQWFYFPIIFIGFLPWTILLLLNTTSSRTFSNLSQRPITLYLILWVGLITGFFSIPKSKLVGYILPVFPGLALWLGSAIEERWENVKTMYYVMLTCTILFLITVMWYAPLTNHNSTKPLALSLQSVLRPEDEVVHYLHFYYDVPLYLKRQVTLVANWHDPTLFQKDNWVRELWPGRNTTKQAASWLIEEPDFWHRFNSQKRVFVFLDKGHWGEFKAHARHYTVLGAYEDKMLVCNQLAIPQTPLAQQSNT
jgi:4-amino-4-deoxy-L-arabinose transferase-like glycosyltransferase